MIESDHKFPACSKTCRQRYQVVQVLLHPEVESRNWQAACHWRYENDQFCLSNRQWVFLEVQVHWAGNDVSFLWNAPWWLAEWMGWTSSFWCAWHCVVAFPIQQCDEKLQLMKVYSFQNVRQRKQKPFRISQNLYIPGADWMLPLRVYSVGTKKNSKCIMSRLALLSTVMHECDPFYPLR